MKKNINYFPDIEIRYSNKIIMNNSFSFRFFKSSVIFLFLSFLMESCNSLPPDLQIRKDTINTKIGELYKKLENLEKYEANNSSAHESIISEYKELKNECISYDSEKDRRGISRNKKKDDERIASLDKKIDKLSSSLESSKSAERKRIEERMEENYQYMKRQITGGQERLSNGGHTCSLCSGTGIERNTAQRTLGGGSGRTCPMCSGKGWVIDGY